MSEDAKVARVTCLKSDPSAGKGVIPKALSSGNIHRLVPSTGSSCAVSTHSNSRLILVLSYYDNVLLLSVVFLSFVIILVFFSLRLILVIFRKRTYDQPLEANVLMSLTRKTFADETMKKINWVVKMFSEWRMYRNGSGSIEFIECDLGDVDTVTRENLCYVMCRFITEVRKIDGKPFPGKTIYDIVVCVQMYLETYG